MLVPPINFSLVVDGMYRSGHPIDLNYPFLETLGLKTLFYVGDRSESENKEYIDWAQSNGINYMQIVIPTIKEPFEAATIEPIKQCLEVLADSNNYPILAHSNKGKHRVGVLMGVLRRALEGWALSAVYEEYYRFAKSRADLDTLFIELYAAEFSCKPGPRLSVTEQTKTNDDLVLTQRWSNF